MSSKRFITGGFLASTLLAGTAHAEPILGSDPALAAIATSYERQDEVFARGECGMNWDTHVKAADRALVEGFFKQDKDWQTYAGKSAFEVIEHYEEHGDQGNFSGIASVGLAARLMVLKRDGAPPAEIEKARAAAIRAARTWHVFATIAGPDTVARGVRRVAPESGTAPVPGVVPALVPLKDAQGNPQPSTKADSWRAPVAAGYDNWIWRDNTSKDQVAGYALGVLYLWDALEKDPATPKDVLDDLANDLVRFVKNLMKSTGPSGIDLTVKDADGRLTSYGDLNARFLTNGIVISEDSNLKNGFNAALAMGIVRAALYVSDDPTIKAFYYDELVKKREYPKAAVSTATLMYQNEGTNFSNVNMLAIALATLGRVETDPDVRKALDELVEKFWTGGGQSRAAMNTEQPWFDVIVAGFGKTPKSEVPGRMTKQLGAHPMAPTFQRDRINCDDTEIQAGSCLAIDGTTTLSLSSAKGWNGIHVAKTLVPLTVRPDTNFLWRSDPFSVNGGPSNRINPRGDWLAAYWLGRLLDRDPAKNIATKSTPPVTTTPNPEDTPPDPSSSSSSGSTPNGGDSMSPSAEDSGGCGCKMHASTSPAFALGLLPLVALALRRRRQNGLRAAPRARPPSAFRSQRALRFRRR